MDTFPAENVFFEETYENGVRLTVVDLSRKIAGDRWQVKIICNVSIVRRKIDFCIVERELAETADEACWPLKQLVRQRNFVDGEERIEVCNELLRQLKTTVFPYLKSDSFVDRLLDRSFPRKNLTLKEKDEGNPFEDLDKDDGPADFSCLFKH